MTIPDPATAPATACRHRCSCRSPTSRCAPTPRTVGNLAAVLAGVLTDLATDAGAGSAVLTLERVGRDAVLAGNRQWAAGLQEAYARAGVPLRGVYLSTSGGAHPAGTVLTVHTGAVASPDLAAVRRIVAREHGLASVSVVRADGTPHASLVNAGVLEHPRTGRPVVGYVTYGAVKLRTLRERPATSLLWRAGWEWVGVDGTSELVGPDDPADDVDAEGLRLLLRAVFTGAGGTHDDWDTYDRVMREERRVAVLVEPARVYGNYS